MSFHELSHARIVGIAACVPQQTVSNSAYTDVYTEKELKKIIKSTGIQQRRFASETECGSDFAFAAAEKLIRDLMISRDSIDLLIYLTQTPDYLLIPPTSCILQDRLRLSRKTGAFDINMNCSGFIYALSTAFAFASATEGRVLLCCGETLSKVFSAKDKTTSLLFGDGGAAVLIDYTAEKNKSFFSLNTDGGNYSAIIIPEGGYRNPITEQSLIPIEYEDGSVRQMNQGCMDGMRVFDFTQNVVIPDIRELFNASRITKDDITYFFFHQANKFMINLFAAELDIPREKCPISLDRFGNTSTVSIPLGIVSDFGKDATRDLGKVIFSGFGGGLSWGTTCLDLNNCYIASLQEFEP